MDYRLAVVIPCYNEEITVAKVISDIKAHVPAAGKRAVALDRGSTLAKNNLVLARNHAGSRS